METKMCSKCRKELPLTNKYFYTCKKAKSGFKSQCKECGREYDKEHSKKYYEEHKETLLKNMKEYHELNAEKHKEGMKEYYKNNRENILEHVKQYRENNRNVILVKQKKFRDNPENKERIKEGKKQFYIKNKDKLKEKYLVYRPKKIILDKLWRERNKDKIKQYNLENKEKLKINMQRRMAIKKDLPHTLTLKQWENIKLKFDNKCCYCGEEKILELEHFIPISKGGEYTTNNIVPSCRNCNAKKHTQDFFKWYPKQKFYSKKREDFILEHLGYKKKIQQLKII